MDHPVQKVLRISKLPQEQANVPMLMKACDLIHRSEEISLLRLLANGLSVSTDGLSGEGHASCSVVCAPEVTSPLTFAWDRFR